MNAPSRKWAGWCAAMSVVGAAVAGSLSVLHLGLLRGELLGGAVCRADGAFNCHAVTGGAWGVFLGMPVALWGVLGYLLMLGLALYALSAPDAAQPAMTLAVAAATLFLLIDAALFALMAVVIRYYCLLCLGTYALNALLLVAATRASGRSWGATLVAAPRALAALVPAAQHPAAWLFWGFMAVSAAGVAGVHVGTMFVIRGTLGSVRPQIETFIANQKRVSVDTAGDPRIGPTAARLQLVEFSDFFCPACQRASKITPIILASHRRDTAFMFKHYPLDAACNDRISRTLHPGACRVAAASECAHEQGQFWAFHDLVFAEAPPYKIANLEQDAARLGLDMPAFLGCLDTGRGMEAVKRDIAEGAAAGISSTPTYVLNGLPIAGGLTPVVFEEFVALLRDR